MSNPLLIILSAPSGAGKTTLCKRILADFIINISISVTTRQPRGKEQEGVDYHFVTEEQFLELKQKDAFAEYAHVHNNWYGTLKSSIDEALTNNQSLLFDIDLEGAANLARAYRTLRIFIEPPSIEVLEQRLRARGEDNEATIAMRLMHARQEIARKHECDHSVINKDLEVASKQIEQILLPHLRKR